MLHYWSKNTLPKLRSTAGSSAARSAHKVGQHFQSGSRSHPRMGCEREMSVVGDTKRLVKLRVV